MTKLFLKLCVLFFISILTLTSCLEGGGNSVSGSAFGMITSDQGKRLVSVVGGYLYVPALNDESLENGDCIHFFYEIDYDSDENKVATKYNTATLISYVVIDQFETTPFSDESILDDISTEEVTLVGIEPTYFTGSYINYLYSSHKFFVIPKFASYLTNQENDFKIYFDPNQETEKVEEFDNVYTLYVKAYTTREGKTPEYKNAGIEVGFDMSRFYNALKHQVLNNKQEYLRFRFKYPESFNTDSTAVEKWATSAVISVGVAEE